jgi:hypothetical protein
MDESGFALAKDWLNFKKGFPYVPISKQAPLKAGRTNGFRITFHEIEGLPSKVNLDKRTPSPLIKN